MAGCVNYENLILECVGSICPNVFDRSVFKHKNMKVFKFYCGETMYAFAAETKELAINEF